MESVGIGFENFDGFFARAGFDRFVSRAFEIDYDKFADGLFIFYDKYSLCHSFFHSRNFYIKLNIDLSVCSSIEYSLVVFTILATKT